MVAAILTLRIATDTAFVSVRTWKADIRNGRQTHDYSALSPPRGDRHVSHAELPSRPCRRGALPRARRAGRSLGSDLPDVDGGNAHGYAGANHQGVQSEGMEGASGSRRRADEVQEL